ncbi:class I SAM-dependent methyltransferase [Phytohabitans sp. ZYX-F-186]|uniref:Class I SAM-dependent methyltransferase n=1 Tax=Phytohabitans maris TaxID=3071409 RepID=A0ABU0ZA60_9ACTN|nr:class I SAM-dependent methyltransferase [Phytohabitans sp. ZYX-F-186]MDQ7903946.1 class I SAM-dependent methyltransferase [Phytohabitans sp. ZYX-F-186]
MNEALYAGSARYYAAGRLPYPPEVATVLRDGLGLDGRGRLLDVGCGPGSVTRLLAPLFESAVGVDADRDMVEEARRSSVDGVEWRHLRAEELPAGLGTFRVATFAQSFHWMDRPLVARLVRGMLEPGGAWVHVDGITHRGESGTDPLPHPQPPHEAIGALVRRYLGPVRRAGTALLPQGTPSGEAEVMLAAGYTGPERLPVVGGTVHERSADQVVASVFSLSWSAPHLFGERLAEFERDLRSVLRSASPSGWFAERAGDVALVVWRPGEARL